MKITYRKKGINLKAKYLTATKQELLDMTKEQYEKEIMPKEFMFGHSKFNLSKAMSQKICGYYVNPNNEYILLGFLSNDSNFRIYVGSTYIIIHPTYKQGEKP
jgi:hypothetical protein